MALQGLVDSQDFGSFLEAAEAAVGGELFVISHDLRQLRSLRPTGEVITDNDVLDTIAGGSSVRYQGRLLQPFLSRRFPLLVAARDGEAEGDEQQRSREPLHELGPIADFLRDFFDEIETRRRRERFTPEAQLQWSMLPVRAARTASLEIAGALQPAASVAGDAYDFAINGDGNLTTLVMDAMGHGVTATLSTSLALATVRTVRRDGGSIVDQVTAADDLILSEYGGSRFVTMVAVEFTPDDIRVVNAGHEPIRRMYVNDRVRGLSIPADPPLGLDGPSDYTMRTLEQLEPGEGLALLSDGAAEAADPAGLQFGPDSVDEALTNIRTSNSLQTAHRFSRAIMDYVAGPLNDDLTVVVVQRHGA